MVSSIVLTRINSSQVVSGNRSKEACHEHACPSPDPPVPRYLLLGTTYMGRYGIRLVIPPSSGSRLPHCLTA